MLTAQQIAENLAKIKRQCDDLEVGVTSYPLAINPHFEDGTPLPASISSWLHYLKNIACETVVTIYANRNGQTYAYNIFVCRLSSDEAGKFVELQIRPDSILPT
jgi:hypothetical protein